MSYQTQQPIEHLGLQVAGRAVSDLVAFVCEGDILLDTPYQRGDVWTTGQRIMLIRSLLSGVPIPAIIVNRRDWRESAELGYWAVIDGKQRLTTVKMWLQGDLAVPASWFPADHVQEPEDTPDGPYVRYTGLHVIAQRFFKRHAVLPVAESRLASVQEEAAVYLAVNGYGTPQTAEDLARAADVAGANRSD